MVLAACATPRVDNAAGRATVYQDPRSAGLVSGVGLGSQDFSAMSDELVRDLISRTDITRRATSPRIIVDSVYFSNNSSQRMNKDIIINQMRADLQRAASRNLVFVGRAYSQMVQDERDLKRENVVDVASGNLARAQFGADYRMGGTITSFDENSTRSGISQRLTTVQLELIDLETSEIIWIGTYTISKAGQEDVIYR